MFAAAAPLILLLYLLLALIVSVVAGFGFRIGWELAGRRLRP